MNLGIQYLYYYKPNFHFQYDHLIILLFHLIFFKTNSSVSLTISSILFLKIFNLFILSISISFDLFELSNFFELIFILVLLSFKLLIFK